MVIGELKMKMSEKARLDNYVHIRDCEYKYYWNPYKYDQFLNNWQATKNSIFEEYCKYWWWWGFRERELAAKSDGYWESKNVSI